MHSSGFMAMSEIDHDEAVRSLLDWLEAKPVYGDRRLSRGEAAAAVRSLVAKADAAKRLEEALLWLIQAPNVSAALNNANAVLASLPNEKP